MGHSLSPPSYFMFAAGLFAVGKLRPNLRLNRHPFLRNVLHVKELWPKIIFLFVVANAISRGISNVLVLPKNYPAKLYL